MSTTVQRVVMFSGGIGSRIESGGQIDLLDIGGCGCFTMEATDA